MDLLGSKIVWQVNPLGNRLLTVLYRPTTVFSVHPRNLSVLDLDSVGTSDGLVCYGKDLWLSPMKP